MTQVAEDYLKNELLNISRHPKGRNPYAHVVLCVKEKFENFYKDINDNDYFQETFYNVF